MGDNEKRVRVFLFFARFCSTLFCETHIVVSQRDYVSKRDCGGDTGLWACPFLVRNGMPTIFVFLLRSGCQYYDLVCVDWTLERIFVIVFKITLLT